MADAAEITQTDPIAEFIKCLGTMSHSRAGWDYYDMSREQRQKEDREEKDALSRARAIWSENPDRHDDLRAAFAATSPLARMQEIEDAPKAKGAA